MYNQALVTERLAIITTSVNRLQALAGMPADEFGRDEDAVDIAENRLRRALEAFFDLGRHLVVKSGQGVPSDYRSVIDKLGEAGIIPPDFSQRIAGLAGYRNRLIHDYNKVTTGELHELLQHRLSDLTSFCAYVVDFLAGKTEEQPAGSPVDG